MLLSIFKKYCRFLPVFLSTIALVWIGCGDRWVADASRVDPQILGKEITGLQAAYNRTTNLVRLTWDKPDTALGYARSIAFYRVYRMEYSVGIDTAVDTSYFRSTPELRFVNKDSSSFSTVIDLTNGTYYYAIQPAFVLGDTAYGVRSSPAAVSIGGGVAFSINRGALFTSVDTCELNVNDWAIALDSVSFSDSTVSGISKGKKVFVQPYRPVGTAVLNSFGWRLKKGGGEKRVYARLKFKRTLPADSARIDTVEDVINISPFRIQMRINNEKQRSAMELYYDGISGTKVKQSVNTIYDPFVSFKVSVFGDTTVDTAFQYFLLFSDSNAYIENSAENTKISRTLKTKTQTSSLSGFGFTHNEETPYQYDFGPNSSNIDTLDTLISPKVYYRSASNSYHLSPLLLKNTKFADPLMDTLLVSGAIKNGGVRNFERLKAVEKKQLGKFGKKDFWVVARFRGRYFNELRTVISSRSINQQVAPVYTCVDFYPPQVYVEIDPKKNPLWISANTILSSVFSLHLNQGTDGAVIDKGFAAVDSILLVIAKQPPPTSIISNATKDSLLASMSMDSLLALRHETFAYPIPSRDYKTQRVQWNALNPMNWPTGEYIFAVITADEFGNKGIAITSAPQIDSLPPVLDLKANPWSVKISTGK